MQATETVSVNTSWQPDKRDRPFFTSMLVAVWLAILSGFEYHNVQKYCAGYLTYPWIVHIHAVFFVGWLLFFTGQLILVRGGQVGCLPIHLLAGWLYFQPFWKSIALGIIGR